MCEVNTYLIKNDKETLIMERVYKLDFQENQVHIENLFGEQKFLSASLKEINFEKNRMILEKIDKKDWFPQFINGLKTPLIRLSPRNLLK